MILGLIILATSGLFVPFEIEHPLWMISFLVLTCVTFSLFGFLLGIWAEGFEKLQTRAFPHRHAPDLPRRQLLLHQHVAAFLADGHLSSTPSST